MESSLTLSLFFLAKLCVEPIAHGTLHVRTLARTLAANGRLRALSDDFIEAHALRLLLPPPPPHTRPGGRRLRRQRTIPFARPRPSGALEAMGVSLLGGDGAVGGGKGRSRESPPQIAPAAAAAAAEGASDDSHGDGGRSGREGGFILVVLRRELENGTGEQQRRRRLEKSDPGRRHIHNIEEVLAALRGASFASSPAESRTPRRSSGEHQNASFSSPSLPSMEEAAGAEGQLEVRPVLLDHTMPWAVQVRTSERASERIEQPAKC